MHFLKTYFTGDKSNLFIVKISEFMKKQKGEK